MTKLLGTVKQALLDMGALLNGIGVTDTGFLNFRVRAIMGNFDNSHVPPDHDDFGW